MVGKYGHALFPFSLWVIMIGLAGCQDDDLGLNLSDVQIQSIEECISDQVIWHACTAHQFVYTDGRLQAIDSEQLIYDEYGALVGTRMHRMDTTFRYRCASGDEFSDCERTDEILSIKETLEKYTYQWEGGYIVSRTLDTLMIKTIVDGIPASLAMQTDLPSADYYYSGDLLDSVSYHHPVNGVNISKVVFAYDAVGNIATRKEYYRTDPYAFVTPPPVAASPYSEVITEFLRYDDMSNPYYTMFRRYGVMLNQLEGKSLSKNNPTEAISRIQYNGGELEIDHRYEYEYRHGLPTTIYLNKGTAREVVTRIAYH